MDTLTTCELKNTHAHARTLAYKRDFQEQIFGTNTPSHTHACVHMLTRIYTHRDTHVCTHTYKLAYETRILKFYTSTFTFRYCETLLQGSRYREQ